MANAIDIAVDGQELVEKVAQKHYDIIFTDLMMPRKDGWQAVNELRQLGYKQPIIAMTATASNKMRQKAIKSGMNDYITKPFELVSIKNILLKFSYYKLS
ncbi:MAG: response regulator [Bacteroidales bacterium]|nr:response regulator [Bacteroidales bacterium]